MITAWSASQPETAGLSSPKFVYISILLCNIERLFALSSSPAKHPTDSAIIGKNSLGSGVLPSIFTVAAAALVGGSNSSNNANNHSSSTASLHGGGGSGKDHNNNSIAKRGGAPGAAASTNELNFRDYKAPIYNEALNAHNALTFKLVKTGRYLRESYALYFPAIWQHTVHARLIDEVI